MPIIGPIKKLRGMMINKPTSPKLVLELVWSIKRMLSAPNKKNKKKQQEK